MPILIRIWPTYDEVFQSLRFLMCWAWDSINWELWPKASLSVRCGTDSPVQADSPFPVKGRVGPCFVYNRVEPRDRDTCYFAHKCRSLSWSGHLAVRCYQAMGRRPQSSSPSVPVPPPVLPLLGGDISQPPQFVLQFCRKICLVTTVSCVSILHIGCFDLLV